MVSKYEVEQLARVIGQIFLDVLIMGAIVYSLHFLFYYPKVWLTAIILFSVLLRTGWWERIERWSRGRTKSPRV